MLAAARRRHEPDRARAARRLHGVPQPGRAGEARRHDRRDQRRALHLRPGRRLERDGVPGLRDPVRQPDRPVRGGIHDHPRPAPGRRRSTSTAPTTSARDCELLPRGPRPGGPPLMIGSSGERMLRITAPHVDSWNAWYADTRNAPAGVAALAREGRRGVPRGWSRSRGDRADGRGPGPDAGRDRPRDGRHVRRRRRSGRSRAPRQSSPRSSAPTPARASATSSSSSIRSPGPRSRNSHRSSAMLDGG